MRAILASLLILSAAAAHAETTDVRVGDHPGFGRVVFDLEQPTPYELSRRGNRVEIVFSGAPSIGMPDSVPRNVVSVVGGDGSATLVVTPGARVRPLQVGSKLVVDVWDPPARSRSPQSAIPAGPAVPAAAAESPAPPAIDPVLPIAQKTMHPPAEKSALPAPKPAEPIGPAPVPAAPTSAAEPSPPPAVPHETPAPARSVLRVPAAADVGAAAFRSGDVGIVVFDARVTLPEDAAGFPGLDAKDLGKATVLTIPLEPGQSLAVAPDKGAWQITRNPTESGPPVVAAPTSDGIGFHVEQPGRVLAVTDPMTGQVVLVGTSKQPTGLGPLVPEARVAPGYHLLQTWLGIALEPTSDQVDLRSVPGGFALIVPDRTSPARVAPAAIVTRFGFPSDPEPVLIQKLRAQIEGAASLPPRARGSERVAAARTMIALGMGLEAQALLGLAATDDPAVASDPTASGMAGVAAVLAGRPSEATGLDDRNLDGNDEVTLWRALRDVGLGKSADGLAPYVRLVLTYPPALQRRVLPPVVEAALAVDHSAELSKLVADSPLLGFAHALQQERSGDIDAALAGYDKLEKGLDRADAVRAAIAAAELRLSAGRITPAAAADLLERQTIAWRGDAREVALRLRVADLRAKAGSWRAALEMLRETESTFPNAKAEARLRKAEVVRSLLADGASISPLELVSLAGDFADCVPDGAPGEAMAGLLADKLLALDLPDRAGPVLQGLMTKSPVGSVRAEFGTRLAQLYLDNGEPAKAEASLAASDAPGLSQARIESRTLLLARARAAQSDTDGAIRSLLALGSPAADALRAKLLAKVGDWHGSLVALQQLSSKTVPASGDLSEQQQDTVLEQATAAAQVGDEAAIRALRAYSPRITGQRADVFRTLTASSVGTLEDLPRVAGELALSRAFPSRVEALTRR